VAGVEERVVLEEGDSEGCGVQCAVGEEVVVGGGEDREQGAGVGGVFGGGRLAGRMLPAPPWRMRRGGIGGLGDE